MDTRKEKRFSAKLYSPLNGAAEGVVARRSPRLVSSKLLGSSIVTRDRTACRLLCNDRAIAGSVGIISRLACLPAFLSSGNLGTVLL